MAEEKASLPLKRDLLALLRTIFKEPEYVGLETGIHAYILPGTDAHQVV